MVNKPVAAQEAGQRLDKFLLKYFNAAPPSFVYKMLRKKRIKLNGGRAEGGEILQAGDTLTFYLADGTMDGFMREKAAPSLDKKASGRLAVIYEDERILVLNKPAGLLSHPEKPGESDTLIGRALAYLYEKGAYDTSKTASFTPALANRLDRNTSGLTVCGKDLASLQELNRLFALRLMRKFYTTLVVGQVSTIGTIHIEMDKRETLAMVGQGRETFTSYRPLRTGQRFSLLEVEITTGRFHQIRAALASIGHSVAGDPKYGDPAANRLLAGEFGQKYQMLHCGKLASMETEGPLGYLRGLTFEAPLPRRFAQIADKLV